MTQPPPRQLTIAHFLSHHARHKNSCICALLFYTDPCPPGRLPQLGASLVSVPPPLPSKDMESFTMRPTLALLCCLCLALPCALGVWAL